MQEIHQTDVDEAIHDVGVLQETFHLSLSCTMREGHRRLVVRVAGSGWSQAGGHRSFVIGVCACWLCSLK
jgi:hypothetical protein